MSLDVWLHLPKVPTEQPRQAILVRQDGQIVEITRDEWDKLHPGVEPVLATINGGDAETTEVYSSRSAHSAVWRT